MISFICKWFSHTRPIPDVDIRFAASCLSCNRVSCHATRGGRYGVKHCYHCGDESPMFKLSEEQWRDSLLHSWSHWQDYPRLPYNWHTLPEAKRLEILKG